MTRIAITGASGQYGRLATDKLIALGRARDSKRVEVRVHTLIVGDVEQLTGRTARSVREMVEANADLLRRAIVRLRLSHP